MGTLASLENQGWSILVIHDRIEVVAVRKAS